MPAELAGDPGGVVFDGSQRFFLADAPQYLLHPFARAGAGKAQCLFGQKPHAVLVEQAEQQGLGADGRVDQFIVAQGVEQGAGAVPDFLGRAAGLVAGRAGGSPADVEAAVAAISALAKKWDA